MRRLSLVRRISSSGAPVDVMEIDAASNTGVDDIRTLRENVKYAPARGRFKVYIVDEVHMLSGPAFNAFLKTLEEPPAHVVFVLATTDPRKIPATVLSRCQRFDFRPISPGAAHGDAQRDPRPRKGVRFEPAALPLLVRAAEGSLRDALSLLDTAIAYGERSARRGERGAHPRLVLARARARPSSAPSSPGRRRTRSRPSTAPRATARTSAGCAGRSSRRRGALLVLKVAPDASLADLTAAEHAALGRERGRR